jgi:hypothetical protein
MTGNYDFLDDIKKEQEAERAVDYSVTPGEAAALMASYPTDIPKEYEKIKPEEFYDCA